MENLPIDAISLPSRVFYSPSEDKLYFGEVGDYKEVPNLDDIPTKTSDLTNDGSDETSTYVESDELGAVAFSNSYNDLDNLPTIPTVLNDLSDVDVDGGQSNNDVLAWSSVDEYFTPVTHIGEGGSAHALATTSEHGFMSSTDKEFITSLQKTPSYYYHRTHFIGNYETKTGSSSAQTWNSFRSGNNITGVDNRANGKEFQGKIFLSINRIVRPSTTTISVTFENTSLSIDVGDLGFNNICFVEIEYSLYFHSGNIAEILYNYKVYNSGYDEGVYTLFGSDSGSYTNSGSRSIVIQTTAHEMNSITMIKNELIAVN